MSDAGAGRSVRAGDGERSEALVTVELACNDTGSGEPLVILHGLLGAKRNWATVAKALAGQRRVLWADLRNHGSSPWDDAHTYPDMAADVARLVETRIGGPATVLGHSMGGKVAMLLALTRPERVARLVVVDIAPTVSQRAPRDFLAAMRGVPLAACRTRAEADAALAQSVADPAVRGFLMQNVANGPDGLSWGVNLDALERHFESIRGFPTIPHGRAYSGPTLFIAGGRSDYIRPEHAAEIDRLFPRATTETLPAAGHWVHADAPAEFVAIVERFLATTAAYTGRHESDPLPHLPG
ncbi:MAG: alpha/beta fold hydrolase [Planctomycetia bacterium]